MSALAGRNSRSSPSKRGRIPRRARSPTTNRQVTHRHSSARGVCDVNARNGLKHLHDASEKRGFDMRRYHEYLLCALDRPVTLPLGVNFSASMSASGTRSFRRTISERFYRMTQSGQNRSFEVFGLNGFPILALVIQGQWVPQTVYPGHRRPALGNCRYTSGTWSGALKLTSKSRSTPSRML